MVALLSSLHAIFHPWTIRRKMRSALPYMRYRLMRKSPLPLGCDALRVETWWGPVIVHRSSGSITASLLRHGVYDLDLCLAVLHAVKPGMTVANIGANVGIYALLAARQVARRGKVYAFEPDPRSFRLLRENAKHFPGVIEPLPLAVGDREGEIDLWLDAGEPGDSSFAQSNTEDGRAHRVHVITMDHFLRERGIDIDVVIMDVQGAEPLVLAGMQQTMRSQCPITILFECSPRYSENMGTSVDRIPVLLHEAGFTLGHIRPSGLPDPEHKWSELVVALTSRKGGYGFCNLVARKTV